MPLAQREAPYPWGEELLLEQTTYVTGMGRACAALPPSLGSTRIPQSLPGDDPKEASSRQEQPHDCPEPGSARGGELTSLCLCRLSPIALASTTTAGLLGLLASATAATGWSRIEWGQESP